jgi:hypothetical protein
LLTVKTSKGKTVKIVLGPFDDRESVGRQRAMSPGLAIVCTTKKGLPDAKSSSLASGKDGSSLTAVTPTCVTFKGERRRR